MPYALPARLNTIIIILHVPWRVLLLNICIPMGDDHDIYSELCIDTKFHSVMNRDTFL